MKVYISALGRAGKLKFSRYVHLLSVNQIFQYRQYRNYFNIGYVYIFEQGLHISALVMKRKLYTSMRLYLILICIFRVSSRLNDFMLETFQC